MSDLDDWRKRIDEIDQQLVKLLNERSGCAVEIGHIKKKLNLPAWAPEREVEILRNVVKTNRGPLDDAAIRRLFERIIDEARSLERHAMDAHTGPVPGRGRSPSVGQSSSGSDAGPSGSGGSSERKG
ncbi:MAG: chorismate mutase [Acidobacteria bacterium]|nr:MAG: chorismate mutase [Acidobacteriota bacterium]